MENCEECFRIRCNKCGWEANDKEALLVKKEILIKCPVCGWSPRV